MPDGAPLPRSRPLARSWVLTVAAAEVLGFSVTAVVAALATYAPAVVALTAVPAAGAVEGALLGTGQAIVLQHVLPDLPVRRWMAVTSAVAVVAFLVGLLPSAAMAAWPSRPPMAPITIAVLLGAVLLVSIGMAQWTILRWQVTRAGRWIAATAVAGTAGAGVFLACTMPLWLPGQPIAFTVAVGVAGGLVMAATTGAVSGLAVRRRLR
jgi:hypothetical protein